MLTHIYDQPVPVASSFGVVVPMREVPNFVDLMSHIPQSTRRHFCDCLRQDSHFSNSNEIAILVNPARTRLLYGTVENLKEYYPDMPLIYHPSVRRISSVREMFDIFVEEHAIQSHVQATISSSAIIDEILNATPRLMFDLLQIGSSGSVNFTQFSDKWTKLYDHFEPQLGNLS